MQRGRSPDVPLRHASPPMPESVPPKRSKAHYLWAVLIARIYEVFPLLCPICGGQMRLIAFITEGVQIKKILDHIGVGSEPPHMVPACGPPLALRPIYAADRKSRSRTLNPGGEPGCRGVNRASQADRGRFQGAILGKPVFISDQHSHACPDCGLIRNELEPSPSRRTSAPSALRRTARV